MTPLVCTPRSLPRNLWAAAAARASTINPLNHAPVERLMSVMKDFSPKPSHLAVLTTKYWHTKGVKLSVGFLDSPPTELRTRIISHMNAWAKTAKVQFSYAKTDPQVRISRDPKNEGYWSYLGTDILSIVKDSPTMNLESFTMATSDQEFCRVVRHETGHTLGFPHEHMRAELVKKIDAQKAIEFYGQTQGWSEEQVRLQVLTPIEKGSLWGTLHADPKSIMCYQVPGSITKDGKPILGGLDIDKSDYAFACKVYPKK